VEDSEPSIERQQAALMDMLRRAAGAPVSYAQLHDAGIEFPASVVSELELAGVNVERCDLRKRGARRQAGVRLATSREPPEMSTRTSGLALGDARTGLARAARALGGSVPKLSPPVVALFAGGVAAVLLLIALSGGGRRLDAPGGHHRRGPAVPALARSHVSTAAGAGAAVGRQARPAPHAVPVSSSLAAQLDAQGHEMLESGRYGEAIGVLERTLAATGSEPSSRSVYRSARPTRQPTGDQTMSTATTIDRIGTVIVTVNDQDSAVAFYTEKLGFEKRTDTAINDDYRWVEVAPTGAETTIAVVPPRPGDSAGGAQTGIALSSSDVDADHAALRSRGVDVDESVSRMGGPVPPMFWLRDPDGNSLLVVQRQD
jgi:catechol 2,3-dioxygenase-like lactoylglutathione lyase family enzyme